MVGKNAKKSYYILGDIWIAFRIPKRNSEKRPGVAVHSTIPLQFLTHLLTKEFERPRWQSGNTLTSHL